MAGLDELLTFPMEGGDAEPKAEQKMYTIMEKADAMKEDNTTKINTEPVILVSKKPKKTTIASFATFETDTELKPEDILAVNGLVVAKQLASGAPKTTIQQYMYTYDEGPINDLLDISDVQLEFLTFFHHVYFLMRLRSELPLFTASFDDKFDTLQNNLKPSFPSLDDQLNAFLNQVRKDLRGSIHDGNDRLTYLKELILKSPNEIMEAINNSQNNDDRLDAVVTGRRPLNYSRFERQLRQFMHTANITRILQHLKDSGKVRDTNDIDKILNEYSLYKATLLNIQDPKGLIEKKLKIITEQQTTVNDRKNKQPDTIRKQNLILDILQRALNEGYSLNNLNTLNKEIRSNNQTVKSLNNIFVNRTPLVTGVESPRQTILTNVDTYMKKPESKNRDISIMLKELINNARIIAMENNIDKATFDNIVADMTTRFLNHIFSKDQPKPQTGGATNDTKQPTRLINVDDLNNVLELHITTTQHITDKKRKKAVLLTNQPFVETQRTQLDTLNKSITELTNKLHKIDETFIRIIDAFVYGKPFGESFSVRCTDEKDKNPESFLLTAYEEGNDNKVYLTGTIQSLSEEDTLLKTPVKRPNYACEGLDTNPEFNVGTDLTCTSKTQTYDKVKHTKNIWSKRLKDWVIRGRIGPKAYRMFPQTQCKIKTTPK
jgi:hypothetical protein